MPHRLQLLECTESLSYHVQGWHNELDEPGLAYEAAQSPPNSYSNWLRYTDGTVNVWHNMERVGVVVENGHPTHFTFAVTDVNKNATGISQGGSKILVVPFNGVQFDCDNGDEASCEEAADGGAHGPTDAGGVKDGAAEEGSGDAGRVDAGGVKDGAAEEGSGDAGRIDASTSGGASSSSSSGAAPSSSSGAGPGSSSGAATSTMSVAATSTMSRVGPQSGAGGSGAGSHSGGSGGAASVPADAGSVSGGGSSNQTPGQTSGCGCKTAGHADSMPRSAWLGGVVLAGSWILRRRRARSAARFTFASKG